MHELTSGFEMVMRGGFMMIPLLIAALVALSVIFERIYSFKKRFITPRELLTKALTQLEANKIEEALASCRGLDTPATSVLAAGITHFKNPLDEMELAMKNRAEEWLPILEKRIEVIDTVITAAPLMGLLGTITGMMASFRVLSEKGVNEPNAITGGVAEALIATATGIVIALMCLFAYNYLTSRVRGFIYEVESIASRLMEMRMSLERAKK